MGAAAENPTAVGFFRPIGGGTIETETRTVNGGGVIWFFRPIGGGTIETLRIMKTARAVLSGSSALLGAAPLKRIQEEWGRNAVVGGFFRPIGGGTIEALSGTRGITTHYQFFRPIGGGTIEARPKGTSCRPPSTVLPPYWGRHH